MNAMMQELIEEVVAERMLEGIKQERAIAKAEKREIIANLLNTTNLTKSEIALTTKVPLSEVEAIAKELNSSTKPTL